MMGVINESWFKDLKDSRTDIEKSMTAGIILYTISQAELDSHFQTIQPQYLAASERLCQSSFYQLLFFRPDPCSSELTSRFLTLFSTMSHDQVDLISFIDGRFKFAKDVIHFFDLFYKHDLQSLPLFELVMTLSTVFETLPDEGTL